MVHGLANTEASLISIVRAERPFSSIEDLRCRAGVPTAALKRLAEADAYRSLDIDQRKATWTIEGMADEVLPLFAAATSGIAHQPEIIQVVEDYRSVGLTLRRHPMSFLRQELTERRILSCSDLQHARDGQRVTVAGLVLVRQKPGSAKGVTFMTIEDETEVANLVIWSGVFEKQRRLILSARMIGCRGRLQREGGVTHLIAEHFIDLSDLLRSVAERDGELRLRSGRGDESRIGTRDRLRGGAMEPTAPPDTYEHDRERVPAIKIATRDFR